MTASAIKKIEDVIIDQVFKLEIPEAGETVVITRICPEDMRRAYSPRDVLAPIQAQVAFYRQFEGRTIKRVNARTVIEGYGHPMIEIIVESEPA